jgi:PPOX class probable F420-dependent enzyme
VQPLGERELELLTTARRAVLASTRPNGKARLVPITFVFDDGVLYTALDEKPKSVADPRDLARVQDIERDPRVSVLVDAWSEDWSELGWVRVEGKASLIGPDRESAAEHTDAIGLLRTKYPQYASHDLESRPMIRIELGAVRSWFAT